MGTARYCFQILCSRLNSNERRCLDISFDVAIKYCLKNATTNEPFTWMGGWIPFSLQVFYDALISLHHHLFCFCLLLMALASDFPFALIHSNLTFHLHQIFAFPFPYYPYFYHFHLFTTWTNQKFVLQLVIFFNNFRSLGGGFGEKPSFISIIYLWSTFRRRQLHLSKASFFHHIGEIWDFSWNQSQWLREFSLETHIRKRFSSNIKQNFKTVFQTFRSREFFFHCLKFISCFYLHVLARNSVLFPIIKWNISMIFFLHDPSLSSTTVTKFQSYLFPHTNISKS